MSGLLLQGSEVENPDAAMTRKPDDAEPFSGLAFKIMADPFVGTLTFVRIYRCASHQLWHFHSKSPVLSGSLRLLIVNWMLFEVCLLLKHVG